MREEMLDLVAAHLAHIRIIHHIRMIWVQRVSRNSDDLLFGGFLFGGLGLALAASYFGRAYLYCLIITITIYIGIAEANIIEVFGYPATLGTALYGVIFFATDMLTERYGKVAGFQAIKYSVFAAVLFQIFMQLTLMTTAVGDMQWFADAATTVFDFSFRVVLAGLVVYAISQSLDVWLYHKISVITKGKHLWLRNNGSTMVSQGVDTFLFTYLAFYGVFDDWLLMASVAYIFKLGVAVCDTGFLYASKHITPLDERD